jgi:hypothetical protein
MTPPLLYRIAAVLLVFAGAFAVATVVTWRYFFVAPIVFSLLVTLCLTAAAWLV